MVLTWGHIFLLAEKMFSLSDEQLAERLKTTRSAVYRHKAGKVFRFEPPVDVYGAVFAPDDKKPEMVKEYYHKLIVALDSDAFPPDFRRPKYEDYSRSIKYLLTTVVETRNIAKQNRLMQTADASYVVNGTLNQARTRMIQPPIQLDMPPENMLPMSANPFPLGADSNTGNTQLRQMSHPRYKLDELKQDFKNYGLDFRDLDPRLKQTWKPVDITDEFFQCYEHYKVADFVAINPLDFGYRIGEVDFGTVTDGLDYMIRILEFVNHMEIAIEYVLICDETEKIHMDISSYVTGLHKYIDFLRKHSTNSHLLGNTFVLVPDEYDDKEELERKSKKFRENLQSKYENIKRQKGGERQKDKGDLQG